MISESITPSIDLIFKRMEQSCEKPAMFWKGREISYGEFLKYIFEWEQRLINDKVVEGTVCAFLGDFTPEICALIFALLRRRAIMVPLTYEVLSDINEFVDISGAQIIYRFVDDNKGVKEIISSSVDSDLIISFRKASRPGLIVFSSGSTGKPKAILHDCEQVMKKFVDIRQGWRTVLFLLMDHFGGFNTFLSTFANLGVGIFPDKRTPDSIAKVIEESKANLLPATPTFLNLMIANKVHANYDLNSIELITYGTELMSSATLLKVATLFPNAKIKQTYGLSELGVLRSKSEGHNSVWVKVGGEGFQTKVIDDVLWIRSESNMVGYLNAPNPFDNEGWMCTGDQVEVRDGFLRFLGRKSEIINIGGKKVFPIEVETVLFEAPNIRNATVFAKVHPIMGQVAHAKVALFKPEELEKLTERLRMFCNERLAKYKVPVRFTIMSNSEEHSLRFKKIRNIT